MNFKEKQNFPDRKDLTYWLLLLVLILIFIIVLFSNNPNLMNSKLSLASTLASIALAIVAILFSFFQSSDSTVQNSNLIGKMNDLINSIDTLQKINDSLEEKNRNRSNEIENFKSEVNNIITDLATKVLEEKGNVEGISTAKKETLKQLETIKYSSSNSKNSLSYLVLLETYKGFDKKKFFLSLEDHIKDNRNLQLHFLEEVESKSGFCFIFSVMGSSLFMNLFENSIDDFGFLKGIDPNIKVVMFTKN